MAEAFVRTIKRDYVLVNPGPNAEAVLRQLPSWIAHYNEVHPHKGSRISFTPSVHCNLRTLTRVRSFGGYNSGDGGRRGYAGTCQPPRVTLRE
jgi:hypothetical protein